MPNRPGSTPRVAAPLTRETLQALADEGLSTAQAAERLGVTRNTVGGRARDLGVRFCGAYRPGPGCNAQQAAKGWATRRARGWTMPPRAVGPVIHAGTPRESRRHG